MAFPPTILLSRITVESHKGMLDIVTVFCKHHGMECCVEKHCEASRHDDQLEVSLTINYVNYVNTKIY